MKLFDKILCAVDFDESSTVVLNFARELAQQNDATLCVLHVAPLPLNATEFSPIPMDPYPVWEKTARAELEKASTLPTGDDDPVVFDHLGDVYYRLQEKAKALAELDLILAETA